MKKFNKILSLALVLVMVLSLVPAITFGTVAEEITWTEVTTADDLAAKLADANVQYIKINAATLDMTGKVNMTVTDGTVLDANGCVFTGVAITDAAAGLFDLAAGTGMTVKNLTIGSEGTPATAVAQVMYKHYSDKTIINGTYENVTIYANLTSTTHGGMINRYPGGEWTFTNCHVYTTSTMAGSGAGGFFGRFSGNATFTDCSVNGSISNNGNCGGYIGKTQGNNYKFENCVNNATVQGSGGANNGTAGFLGYTAPDSGTMKIEFLACTNTGAVNTVNTSNFKAQFTVAGNASTVTIEYAGLVGNGTAGVANFAGATTSITPNATEVAYAGVNNADALVTALATGGTVKLLSNINMTGKENITVAANTVLDGNGKTLTVAVGTENAKYGLFNFGSNTGIAVKNLTITGTGKNTLVASDNSESATPEVTFENVTVNATLAGIANESGAFGGRVKGTWTFKNCDVTVNVAGSTAGNGGAYFGRFWGIATLDNCAARGTIADAQGNHGGFIGVADTSSLVAFHNCTNYANITSSADGNGWGMAGFVGQSRHSTTGSYAITMLNCTNEGTLTNTYPGARMLVAQFVCGRTSDGHVYYGNLTGNGSEMANFNSLVGSVEVLYDWAQLQTAGEYKIGPAYPTITGNMPVADGVTIDGLNNTIRWNGAPYALFVLEDHSTFVVKNLNIGSADAHVNLYQGILWMTDNENYATDPNASYTADPAASTTNTTWENVNAYVGFTLAGGNSGAFISEKAYGTHTFINCSATICGTSKANREGAFVGRNYGNMTFIRCTANGTITANEPGAFVGRGDGTNQTFIDCVNNTKLPDGTAVENYVALDGVEGTNFFNYTAPQLKAVQETTAEGGVQKIRFLAAVAENYITPETAATSPLKYGFTVSATVGGVEEFADRSFTLNNLYEAVTANEDGATVSVTAGDLGGTYISALVLTGVPAEGTVVFTVTPWMTYADDAAAVEGTTYTVTYTDGAFVSVEPAEEIHLPLVPQA